MTRLADRRTPHSSDPKPPADIDHRRAIKIARIEGCQDIGDLKYPGDFGLARSLAIFGDLAFSVTQLAALVDTRFAKHARFAASATEFAAVLLERQQQLRRAGRRPPEGGVGLWQPTDAPIVLDEQRDGRLVVERGIECVLGSYLFAMDVGFRELVVPVVFVMEPLFASPPPPSEQKPQVDAPKFYSSESRHPWERSPPGGTNL